MTRNQPRAYPRPVFYVRHAGDGEYMVRMVQWNGVPCLASDDANLRGPLKVSAGTLCEIAERYNAEVIEQ
jgi:hypothetical protein